MPLYRFNNLSGKIIGGAAQRVGQAIKGSATVEPPQIIFETKNVKFPVVVERVKPTKPGYGAVPAENLRKYAHFQKEDGVPVHLKGGTTDMVLYYATLVGCAIGVVECFRYYYQAAFPKRE